MLLAVTEATAAVEAAVLLMQAVQEDMAREEHEGINRDGQTEMRITAVKPLTEDFMLQQAVAVPTTELTTVTVQEMAVVEGEATAIGIVVAARQTPE